MAYKIKDIYPSQVSTGDAGWPDGKPRNIQGGIQGTGTPFEEKLFQDYEGSRQALFAEAGVVPSGVADKVGTSDFVGALKGFEKPASSIVLDNGDTVQEFTTQSREAITALYKAQGYNNVFFFEDGFTYTESNDVGVYEDGTAWTYADAGALPVTIATGTVPSEGSYKRVKSVLKEVINTPLPIKHLPDYYATSIVSHITPEFKFKLLGTTLQFIILTVPVSQLEDLLVYWDLDTELTISDTSSATNPYIFCQSVDSLSRANPVTSLQTTSSDRFGGVSTITSSEITKDFLAVSIRVPTGSTGELAIKGITIKQAGVDIFSSDAFRILKSSEKWSSNTINAVFDQGDRDFAIVATVDKTIDSSFQSPERVDIHPLGSSDFTKPPYSLGFYNNTIQQHTLGLASNLNMQSGEYNAYRQDYMLDLIKDTNISTHGGLVKLNAGKEIETSTWTTSTVGPVIYATAPLDVSDNRSANVRSGTQQPSIIASAALNTTRSVFKYSFNNVSSAAEVQATAFSYWYDFSNSTLHFSFDSSLPTSYVYVLNALSGVRTGVSINLNVDNVDVYGANGDGFRVQPATYSKYLSGKGGVYASLTNCSGVACASNALSMDNIDAQVSHFSAMSSGNDGLNFHDNGLTHISNSKSWFNSADGMSHHENCIGYAEDCSFRYNGVAGSVPAYGAYVWHERCELVPSSADSLRSNSYAGKWAVLSNTAGNGKAVFNGCVNISPVSGSLYEAIAQDLGSNTSMYITNPISITSNQDVYFGSGNGVNNKVIQ